MRTELHYISTAVKYTIWDQQAPAEGGVFGTLAAEIASNISVTTPGLHKARGRIFARPPLNWRVICSRVPEQKPNLLFLWVRVQK